MLTPPEGLLAKAVAAVPCDNFHVLAVELVGRTDAGEVGSLAGESLLQIRVRSAVGISLWKELVACETSGGSVTSDDGAQIHPFLQESSGHKWTDSLAAAACAYY